MSKNLKRILSIAAALVMVFALSVSAMAAETETDSVAQVGNDMFSTLQAAIDAADGETVTLLNDTTVDADDTIKVASGKNITLDLNGKTLAGESDQTDDNRNLFDVRGTLNVKNGTVTLEHEGEDMEWAKSTNVFNVTAGGVLNITNATVENKGGSAMAFCVHLNNWGEVTLNVENSTLKATYVPVRVFNSGYDDNNVTIKNSTLISDSSRVLWVHNFTPADFGNSYNADAVEARLNLDIFNNGNTFTVATPDANRLIELGFNDPVNFDANGNFVVRNAWALEYAVSKGGKVILGSDITLDKTVQISAGNEVTIDLNGQIISGVSSETAASAVITNNGNLTIMDSGKGGKITSKAQKPDQDWGTEGYPTYANNTINNYGTLTLQSGTIENTSDGAACYAIDNCAGTVNLEGGVVVNERATPVRLIGSTGSITVEDGTEIRAGRYAINYNLSGNVDASLIINGGEISTTDEVYGFAVYVYSNSNSNAKDFVLNISDGNITGNVALNGVTCTTMTADNISISGGNIGGVICYAEPEKGFITGGTFSSDVTELCAEDYVAVKRDDGTYKVEHIGWVQENDKWYYVNAEGVMQTGWLELDGKWYYLQSDGAMATGWVQAGGNWYYMNASGVMQTGWLELDGKWYFLQSGGAMATGWVQPESNWYYMNASGVMQTGWLQLDGKWYYLQSGGAMATGWVQAGSSWYYMNASGVMQTGWLQLDGKWYYLQSGGAMATGWVQTGSNWYYMNASGVMQTGWLQLGDKWYYLQSNGAMLTGTQTIDGKSYTFNSSGVWVA